MKFNRVSAPQVLSWLVLVLLSLPVAAQQTMSQRLSAQLQQSASEQLDVDLILGQLQVNALTDELRAEEVRLATRVAALSEPLNQLVIADTIRLQGDWQVLGQRNVTISEVELAGAQLTVAYHQTGQSNLHALLDKLQQTAIRYQPASLQGAINWQLQRLRFTDVTINLFDRGTPIASVHVPELYLDQLNQTKSSAEQVDALIFPIIEQLLKQWREGDSQGSDTVQIDGPALTRFLMREALSF